MQNRKLFREMSEPHESKESLSDAFDAFWNDVQASREKYRIQNIVVVIETSYITEGEEVSNLGVSTLGDRTQAESMCSYAFGKLKSEREELLARLLKGKV